MANKIRGLTIQINGETKGLNKALGEVNSQSKTLQNELKQVEKALKLDPTNTELLRQKQTLLAQSVETTRTKLDALRQAQEQMAKANAANAGWERSYEPLKAKINETNTALRKLTAQEAEMKSKMESGDISTEQYDKFQSELEETTKQSKDLAKELRDLEKQFEDGHISDKEYRKFQRELSNTTQELKRAEEQAGIFSTKLDALASHVDNLDNKLGGKLSKTVEHLGTASVIATGAAIKTYVDFGKETTKVSTLLDQSVLSMGDAEKAIIGWSNRTGQAAADVAGSMYDALSAGVETADVQKFMAQATETAAAGFTNSATAVDVLTTILNSYGMQVSSVTNVSDQLLLAQDKGKVTLGEFSNGLGDLVGMAASAGVSLDDLLSAIAALTASGLKPSSSITSLKAAISNMISPSAEASKQAQQLGISFDSQALEANGLHGILNILKGSVGGNTEQMAKLFGSTEALNAMLILSGKGNELYTKTMDDMNASTGKTTEVFGRVKGSVSSGFTDSVNEMKNSLLQLGIVLTPLIKALSGLFSVFGSIPTPVLGTMIVLLSFAATLIKIASAVNVLTSLAGPAGAFFGAFNIGAIKTTAIVLGVVAALIALAAIIAVIIGKGSDLNKTLKSTGDAVSNIAGKSRPQITEWQPESSRSIPGYASGTKFHPGGLALVGEQGAELLELPRGARVYNNHETVKMLDESGGRGGDTFQISVNVESLKDVEQLMKIARDARRMERMGTVRA